VVADVQNEFESPVVVVRKAGQGWNVGGNGPKPLSGRLGVDIGSTEGSCESRRLGMRLSLSTSGRRDGGGDGILARDLSGAHMRSQSLMQRILPLERGL
jgi:hypothetical protein